MAVIQALLAAVTRSAGRLLNTAFGWATLMIFGKVPEDRQIYLSVIAFGSVAWILVALGVAFPRLGTFLLSFVPLPESVDTTLIRLAMLAAAIALPAIVGALSLLLKDPDERPSGAGARAKAILKGYPFTLGLALTLILMTVFAPILKVQALARRWSSQHVPMLVESRDYEAVVTELQNELRAAGWETRRELATWMLRFPTKVLTKVAGGSVENLVADRLTTLRSATLEVMLHPSDLVIQGKEADVIQARAALAERLAFSKAHLTWTEDGNELEDRIRRVWEDLRADRAGADSAIGRLRAIEDELRRVEVPYEEWEVLSRARLLVEVAARRAGGREPEGVLPRVVLPLGLALVRQTFESPRVRASLEEAIVGLLRRVVPRAEAKPAPAGEPDEHRSRAA